MVREAQSFGPAPARAARVTAPPRPKSTTRLSAQLGQPAGFEGLVSRLSATFTHLPGDAVDSAIDNALRQVVKFLDIDRGGVGQFSEDGREFRLTHGYTVPDCPQFIPEDLATAWPWYTEQIRRGRVLRFTRLPDELPAEAVAERAYCAGVGRQSHLVIPFRVGGRVLGGIGFALFRDEIDWPNAVVERLTLLAEVFGNALARKRARQREARLVEELARAGRTTPANGLTMLASAVQEREGLRPRPAEIPAEELQGRAAALSRREREVMALVTRGLLNKQVGRELGIAEKTVKVHRGRVMRKMGAASLAELVRMADRMGLAGPGAGSSGPADR